MAKFPVVFPKRRNYQQLIYWLGFTPDGFYGIHALPDSSHERELGTPTSTGCVRVSCEDGRWLFCRAKIGTSIIIKDH